MTVCYFTATGNCLYVAKRIGGRLLSIPKLMREDQPDISDDAVGIVCPVYCGEMPGMVRRFLSKAKIRTDYFFFVYTYGMSETFAKPNAAALAKKAGLTLSYVGTIKMVDNYLPGFEMQKQKDTAWEKKIEEHIDLIRQEIAMRKVSSVSVGIARKIGMAMVHGTMGRAVLRGTAAKRYLLNDDCIQCGICAKVCPADNITVTDHVTFSDRCEVCYACIHNCPKNAIHLRNERSAARFRNEHIAVREIISSNERRD